ncbi:type I polyketide synthase [Nannocystis radixulma]|uniref:Beta-ketoacyl synthase N-terminal-like domain-containing protein n=1 Tax=Nannocystis radixulma TaxID=2995305 RepID=A0ABT5B3P5_9BACT|nr:type I polyketide synthase [Nannocystis radixulma]MDC0667762.1 beta-ketoacyl synthase N-terminal-like domain-containing protein [Nannocystis radixulma]
MSTDPKDILARALVELRTLRQRLADAQRAQREPIAVVGLGCRFPGGADGPDAFWRLLSAGVDATGELPPGRWPEHDHDPPGMYTRRGGWLAAVDGFDARFFGLSEREAHSLDPQHRLALEVAWEALEHAAIAPDRLRRSRTGVFFGVSTSDYAHLLARHVPLADVDGYFGPGTALNFIPGRIAYFLGLQGPSLAVDTACSSSLVAVHLACASLRARETDLALAGGVNLILGPAGHLVLCRGRVLSPRGRCHTFDAAADGYARGEGCGVVVLRRLADALAAGDPVLAVIRGSAVNQDGPSSGLTVPNPAAQEAVIRDALAFAGLEPAAVDYVEAHGTGTPLGDPIEARALAAALGPGRARPLLLGTVKTNIGHTEAAAGIAGLIKTVLAVHHGALPRHLHFREPNPAIAWDRLPLEVVREHRPWPEGPRIAGVSSFGASGTNAHVILAAATESPNHPTPTLAPNHQPSATPANHSTSRQPPAAANPGPQNHGAGPSHIPAAAANPGPHNQDTGPSHIPAATNPDTHNHGTGPSHIPATAANPGPHNHGTGTSAHHAPAANASALANPRASSPHDIYANHSTTRSHNIDSTHLLLLSAQTPAALRDLAARHADDLAVRPDLALVDRCWTAAVARARQPHALAVVADSPGTLRDALAAVAADDLAGAARLAPTVLGHRPREAPRVVFLFSGQGAQHPGMGRALMAELPVFQDTLLRCAELLRPHLPRPLLGVLHPDDGDADLLDDTAWTQPALFAFEYALACQWRAWGVEPAAVFGHSLGEYVAATVAGVFRLDDVLPLVARRARAMQALPRGSMLAVLASEAVLAPLLAEHERVTIAAVNGPHETVLAGESDAVHDLAAVLQSRELRCRELRVSHAFHSPMMDPALAGVARDVAAVPLAAPSLPLVSDLSGGLAGDEVTRPDYWRRHMREPVRFADGLASLRARGHALFLEIGPGAALTALGARFDAAATWLPSLRSRKPERASLLETLGALAVAGVDVDWPAVYGDVPRRRIALPTYPFQRRRHWLPAAHDESRKTCPPGHGYEDMHKGACSKGHSIEDIRLSGAVHDHGHARTSTSAASDPALWPARRLDDPRGPVFALDLHPDRHPLLRDHTVYGHIVVSGTVHAALALRAARDLLGESVLALDDLEFLAPVLLAADEPLPVQLRFTPAGDAREFELVSERHGARTVHTRGRVLVDRSEPAPPPRDLHQIRARCPDSLDGDEFYARFWRPDEHALGPAYRTIAALWRRDGEALARLRRPALDLAEHGGLGPDAVLAACLGEVHGQLLMPAMPEFSIAALALEHTYLGRSIARSREFGPPARAAYAHALLRPGDGDELCGDVALLDEDGQVLATAEGLRARRIPRAVLHAALARAPRRQTRPARPRERLLQGPPTDLPARVEHYLREQLAAVVGGPPDFDPDVRLLDLGIDSLMAVDLHDAVRSDLGVAFPLDAILQGDTLARLAARLVDALPSAPRTSPDDPSHPLQSPGEPVLSTIPAPPAGRPTSPHAPAPSDISPLASLSSPAPSDISPFAPRSSPAPADSSPPAPLSLHVPSDSSPPAPHSPPPSNISPPAPLSSPVPSDTLAAPARVVPDRWLRPLGPSLARPRLRLVCFPHSGAGPTAFQPWRGRLPADITAHAVQLPGRWERAGEPAFVRMEPLLDALLPALAPVLEPPFVLFGASMGALVAHALTCALRRAGRPLPEQLVVAAYPAPHLPNPLERHRAVLREALRDDSPDRSVLARLGLIPDVLHDPAVLRLLIPALRADFELVLDHEPRRELPLPLPILALGGADDPEVGRDQLAAWIGHTAADFSLRVLPGGHLFFRTHPDATLQALAHALRPRQDLA